MTQQEIINKAKVLLEVSVEGIEDPVWTSGMLESWCQEGQNELISRIKDILLNFLYTTSLTITTPGEQVLDTDFLKLVKVTRAGKKCTIKDVITTNSLFEASIEFPTVYRKGNKIIIEPITTATVEVIYIKTPKFILNSESELPINWQDKVILFICAKALEKDKQIEKASYYLNLFNNAVEIINTG